MERADGDPTRHDTASAKAQGGLVHAPRIEQDPIVMHAVLVFTIATSGRRRLGAPSAPLQGIDRIADEF